MFDIHPLALRMITAEYFTPEINAKVAEAVRAARIARRAARRDRRAARITSMREVLHSLSQFHNSQAAQPSPITRPGTDMP